ncbi:MAG: SulP family inorganic anion transporter [Anaerolineae bacterium]|nr:SulP family inorganic anion transporter [Anaerolineae bacterium]
MLQEWLALLRAEFQHYSLSFFQKDLLAGLTVAAVALPLALAFGVASGADAAAGLVTAVLAGIVMGLLGGSPYQISGPTGAMSAILVVLAARHGLQGVWLVALMAGVILLLLGIFRLGRVVSLIPAPVISGFTSGIAVIIAFGQIDNALGIHTPAAENVVEKVKVYLEHGIVPNGYALALTLLVIVVMVGWGRFKALKAIPGSLAAIVIVTALTALLGWDVPVIGSIPRTILLENRLRFVDIDWSILSQLVLPAMSVAALGAIESLLCGAVAGNMTGKRLHDSVELTAQGIGNILIPFFGGVPATAAIARTSVNIKSGGTTRLTSILHGVILLLTALLLAPVIGRVPLAALAGVLMVTAWRMNEWHAIRFYFGKHLRHAMVAFLITLVATVLLDLTQAIVIGFGISTLMFLSQISDLHVDRQPVDLVKMEKHSTGYVHPAHPISVYYLGGPLFFAAARKLLEQVETLDTPDSTLIFSMRGVPLIDATGIEVLREVWQRQHKGGGEVLLSGLQVRVQTLLERTGFLAVLGSDRVFWSADLAILSRGASVQPAVNAQEPFDDLDETLALTPHEDQAQRRL